MYKQYFSEFPCLDFLDDVKYCLVVSIWLINRWHVIELRADLLGFILFL